LEAGRLVHGFGAFALITLGVLFAKGRLAPRVIRPRVRAMIARAGVELLPMVGFVALALGLAIIGQTVALLTSVGIQRFAGTVMVTVVVRELGPLVAALIVLARVGTATVIELGTARALGEVEALEALGIDPVHYLVVPRVIGISVGVFGLTVYLILGSLVSGYLFAFLQDVPLTPGEYFGQLGAALTWQDFLFLAFKTTSFGVSISTLACYHGLARPLRLEEVSQVTTRTVVHAVGLCLVIDGVFILSYLLAA
jgi:phospholipid/cholesterol/gamma-HCH transport system permease protein